MQVTPNGADPICELRVVIDAIETDGPFGAQVVGCCLAAIVAAADVPAQGPAVQVGEELDVIEPQTVTLHEPIDRGARVVAEVLVVDGIELAMIDEFPHIRVLDSDETIILEEMRHPGHEAIQIGDVGENVVGDDDIGLLSLCPEARGEFGTKELGKGWNACCDSRG